VTLTPYTGPTDITTAGTVIDGKDIPSVVTVSAPNVTIKRSRIRGDGDYGVRQDPGASGLLVEDVEITSANLNGSVDSNGSPVGMIDRAILLQDASTIRRVYIHGTWRGIQLRDRTGIKTIVDSFVGDNVNPSGNHTSALMTDGGTSHGVILHNTLRTAPNTNASSAISLYPQTFAGGSNDDFVMDNNLLDTAGGYAVYLGGDSTSPKNTNFRFTNNHFGTLYFPTCGIYGPVDSWDTPGNTWTGNSWYSPGNAMNGSAVTP